MDSSEPDVLDYLLQHKNGLRDYLRPLLQEFLNDKNNFDDIPELYQDGYEDFFLYNLYDYLTRHTSLSYIDCMEQLPFETIIKLWELDSKGRNV